MQVKTVYLRLVDVITFSMLDNKIYGLNYLTAIRNADCLVYVIFTLLCRICTLVTRMRSVITRLQILRIYLLYTLLSVLISIKTDFSNILSFPHYFVVSVACSLS